VTSPVGDSVWVGDTAADYLPCYWYVNGVLADSNKSGFKVHPDSTTSYVMALEVCGNVTYDTAVVYVFPAGLANLSPVHVLLYPNPATNIITVEGARGCTLTLTNTIGQVVYTLLDAGMKQMVPLAGLTPGVYTLAATNAVTGERVVRMVEKR
jgi:Secretion system C-terminal sorting domain